MGNLPSGTVTFLFTDVEGSTRLAQQYPDSIAALLERHHAILKQVIEAHGGYIFQIIGDAFCAAFQTAPEALDAALEAQFCLAAENWSPEPIRVRMGISTGSAQIKLSDDRPPHYAGYLNLARVQRVMSVAYGGQVLLANASMELARGELPPHAILRDMGEHRLKSLLNPEHLWQASAPGLQEDFPPLKSLNAIPNNLPVQLTSFVGRERELAEVRHLLDDHRLVTLTGAGGTGKSRLALQVAADVLDQFRGGIWFIELAPITDPALIPQTVARVLGLIVNPGREPLDVLKDYLADKSLLFILDNCEHLLDESCCFAFAVLQAAPQVKIMPTSREALNLAGELTYRVPSLSTPDINHLPPVEQLTQFEAVRLFIERAELASRTFAMTAHNAPAVAQICYRLDGIPLAIELAAARVKSMPLDAIVSHLDDRFRLLTGGSRAMLPRQQTLRAMIDWSYALLSGPEKLLLQRLSVFRGSSTLEAAEAVCSGEGIEPAEILDLTSRLADKSLVSLDENERYRTLETVRQYAAERLIESGQAEWARDQHMKYMVELAEKAEPEIRGPNQSAWLDQLAFELDNLRAALAWAQGRNPQLFLRLASALWRFWEIRISNHELMDTLGAALALTEGDRTVARARGLARLAFISLDFDLSGDEASAREAYELSTSLGDKSDMVFSLATLGSAKAATDPVGALVAAQEAARIVSEIDDPWLALVAYGLAAYAAQAQNDLPLARSLWEQAVEAARASGDRRGENQCLMQLALNCLVQGEAARAEALLHESWPYAQQIGDRIGMCNNRLGLARVAAFREQYGYAEELLEEYHRLALAGMPKEEIVNVLLSQARVERARGKTTEMHRRAQAALSLAKEAQHPLWIPSALRELAEADRLLGNLPLATRRLREALQWFRSGQYKPGYCVCLESLGYVALSSGRADRAARLFAARAKLRITVFAGDFFPFMVRERENAIADAKAQLGEEAFNKAWAKGQAMSEDEMLAYAVEDTAAGERWESNSVEG